MNGLQTKGPQTKAPLANGSHVNGLAKTGHPAAADAPVQPAALGFVGGAGGSAALSRLTQTAIEAARKAPPSPPPAAPQPGGLPGALLKVGGLALAAIAGRYTRSDGELNLLKDTGQIPQRITMQTMSDASRALDKAGTRPDMGPLGTEQRGRFLEGAAAIGRVADRHSGNEVRSALDSLLRNVSAPGSARDPLRSSTDSPFTYSNYMDRLRDHYGPLDQVAPMPAIGPQKTDEDKRGRLNVLSRSVISVNPATGLMEGTVSHIHVPLAKGDPPARNLVHNRLIHDIDGGLGPGGHDGIHLIGGLSLNPKTASPLAPFPMTHLDLVRSGLDPVPPERQRNVNGIAIENMTDGLWEAMKATMDVQAVVAQAPAAKRRPMQTLLNDLDERTGFADESVTYELPFPSDLARQGYELAAGGVGRIGLDAGKGLIYQPDMDTVEVHARNFEQMLKSNPKVAAELKRNLGSYLSYVSQQLPDADGKTYRPKSRLEMTVSPESTRLIMETAIRSFEELHMMYPRSPAFPELINYYRSVLERGEDGTPAIVKAPGGGVATA